MVPGRVGDHSAVLVIRIVVPASYDHVMSSDGEEAKKAPRSAPWAVAVSSGVVLLGLLAAGVVLALSGRSEAEIVGLLMGLATVAGVILPLVGKLIGEHRQLMIKQDQQTQILQQVAWNTNGNLQRIINQAVAHAFQDRDSRDSRGGGSVAA